MIFAMLGEAWRAMGANRLRTMLTMLGMVIGVGAVVLMMSIGLMFCRKLKVFSLSQKCAAAIIAQL